MKLNKLVFIAFLGILPILYARRAFPNFNRRINQFRKTYLEKVKKVNSSLATTEWFEQKVDHFNPIDQGTYQQKYFALDTYYKPGGPVFLMIEGEGPASGYFLEDAPNFSETAKEVNAFLFDLEHRYYGESLPTEDVSLENLRFLTSEQALADAANFIVGMNEKYNFPPDTKWIAYGGSYAGSLAAWLRLKYPHLVYGAVSSSGPLQAIVDFEGYYRVVEDSIQWRSVECLEEIRKSFDDLIALSQNETGRQRITDIFYLCDPLEQSIVEGNKNLTNFYNMLMEGFATEVQYNDYVDANTTYIDLDCEIMVDPSLSPIERLARFSGGSGDYCLSYNYDELVSDLEDTSWSSISALDGARTWYYQTCAEFGFYQTASDAFSNSVNITYYEDLCKDVYSASFNLTYLSSVVNHTNMIYGSTNINVTNVIFVNGQIDPWHALGVLETKNPLSPAILIEGASHCANMLPIWELTTPEVLSAIAQIDTILHSWLDS